MGFSGHLVFARSERPLLEAPLFGSTGPGLREDVHEWQSRPDGWQTLRLEQGILDNAAALLVEEPEEVDDVSLWTATPEFQEAIGHKRAELDAEVPNDAEGRSHVGFSSWCSDHGAAAQDRGTAARTGDLRGGAVRRAAGRTGLP